MFFEQSCIFAEFPLDPCDPLRGNSQALAELKNNPSTRFIVIKDGEALMSAAEEETPIYLDAGVANSYLNGEEIFLGKDNEHAYFAVSGDMPKDVNGVFLDMRTIARNATKDGGFSSTPSLVARGKMLLDWHNRHRFCANCGAQSKLIKGGYVRYCEDCDTEHFPRVDPVVIMMVIYKDKCLLGRSPSFLPGMFSALAGFMEPGETIEEATRREVFEEAGIRIGGVEYIKSQPWPFPSSLMIGVIAHALNDDIDIGDDELEEAKWFSKKEIQDVLKKGGDDEFRVPEKLAIARHLLEYHLMLRWVDDEQH